MFEIKRNNGIVKIKYGGQTIEYPIEETQNLVNDLPDEEEYKKQNLLDYLTPKLINTIQNISMF